MGDSDPIRTLLASARTIAVVGCSADPERDSHHVAAYLQRAGYRVIPVNPAVEELLGERCYPDLAAIPDDVAIDIVDVFRRPEHVPPIAEQAIARGARALWLQLGVSHPEAERRAAEAGLQVVSNRCMAVEHRLRFGG
ncbi:MAG TPA: CoA-binding protein [Thermoanaerobaculales bacterium]|nr:CoA-binding protein [Thermoanaerobaculales bacterium]HPA80703.1 CoA-binding protein [Thermoanaerobaculales bacterium]HQP42939.1 CoA-binding protein [Thermoanaerobaculales bacterium]